MSYIAIFSYIISLCPICAKEKAYMAWCQECGILYFKNNFIDWTSENQKIDEIIKETQMNSKTAIDFVEWIPYEQFEKIEKICQGGFGTIYSAFWIQGPLSMLANEFKRTGKIQVALKSCISPEYLEESNEEYMLVIQFAEDDGTPSCFIDLMQRCWDSEPEKRPTSSEIYNIICSWYYLKNYKEFNAFDKILLVQHKQDIELPVMSNIPNYLQNDSYHSCRIYLTLTKFIKEDNRSFINKFFKVSKENKNKQIDDSTNSRENNECTSENQISNIKLPNSKTQQENDNETLSQLDNSENEDIQDSNELSSQVDEIDDTLNNNQKSNRDRKRKTPLNKNQNSKRMRVQFISPESDSNDDEFTSLNINEVTEKSPVLTSNVSGASKDLQRSEAPVMTVTIDEIEKDKATILKNKFVNTTNHQLELYRDQLFSNNKSNENFLITNFDHLFNDDNIINFLHQPLPIYSTSIELLDHYFKEWALQYDQLKSAKYMVEEKMLKMVYKLRGPFLSLLVTFAAEYERTMKRLPTHKTLRGFVKEKMKSILSIDDRQERRYWVGTWRLIELLHLTRCPATILVKAGLTTKYLMRESNNNYDRFLKSLLNDNEANHESPTFDESLMQRLE
ncbi:30969_t:CDS:2 [Gigaspora margarita]|uniref:30969_t:CDS:1 n=1 Tax=Gigaspora margarita TaxID=4874 RepID=A0ABM8VVS0_GIGMA|nr:30969_t:CDS:2 [Gigaspora margarita]